MPTIYEHKEQALTETPLLLFDCLLPDGQQQRWSTHQAAVDGANYDARVLRHNVFEMQAASDQGVDAIPKISITLANADSRFSELERSTGWKGSRLTVKFLFFDLRNGAPATEAVVLFKGTLNPPDEITEAAIRLTAVNRMSMQRVLLPQVRIQKRCPWEFPATAAQREEAVSGGNNAQYSRFFRCGYSPDVAGGAGNLNGAVPFTSCRFTRADCQARGMFARDQANQLTARFGGVEFVPASILVRSYGDKGSHVSALSENEAKYNDFVPLLYGTGWHTPQIVFARNDGNLTRLEILIGMGEIDGVITVLVNDVEIPLGRAGANMTGTGWFNTVTLGNRTGGFNLDFTDGSGNPLGDPYGSMAYLSVVVPNRINDGRNLPNVRVLVRGMKLPRYNPDGSLIAVDFTSNPVWILLDILRRSGWDFDEIDLASFAEAAEYCDEPIAAEDLYGNPATIARFQCNLLLTKRRTAADVIRGIRNASRLLLSYGAGGKLQVRGQNTIAAQQPSKPEWSNSTDPLDGGWPGYEFGDGSSGTSGILRNANGSPSVRVWSRATIDTPNRFAVEFQDAFNEYQQDGLSLVDVDDVSRAGQEITGPLSVLGVPNFSQAARILRFNLDRSVQGNTFVDFETSVRALGLRPGDIISLTYLKEGFDRQLFRVMGISPGMNHRSVRITAQIHDDAWYTDANGADSAGGRRRAGGAIGLPRPLFGTIVDANGDLQFAVTEIPRDEADGGAVLDARVEFIAPPSQTSAVAGIPLVSLAAAIGGGGTLAADQTFYYAVSAVDDAGLESALSFVVRALIPPGGGGNSVTLSGLSFSNGTAAFHIYRGPSPRQLFRIASDQTPATQYVDTGAAEQVVAPTDPNYHHANFYWRLETLTEVAAAIHGPSTAGNSTLQMPLNGYAGMAVRITRGKGAGQERTIVSNTTTTVTLTLPWTVEPDASSYFTIAESGWKFGATGGASPIQFGIPNHTGATVQITGRSANIDDVESPAELALVTRWLIGGAGSGSLDSDVPPKPSFGLTLPGRGGVVEIGGIAFQTLDNTRGITAATATIHFFNELAGQPAAQLAAAIADTDTVLDLTTAGGAAPGSFIQVDREVMEVVTVGPGGLQYEVERGRHASTAASHDVSSVVYPLERQVVIMPFARDFFGSPAGGDWSYPVVLPEVRVSSAELFVSNSVGAGEAEAICVTQNIDRGLRTLAGGEFSITIDGFLAIEDNAAPDLVVDNQYSVRDVYAVVREQPVGAPVDIRLKQDGVEWCALSIPAGDTASGTVNGFFLPPLAAGARVGVDITSVGQAAPGTDLTIVIRL